MNPPPVTPASWAPTTWSVEDLARFEAMVKKESKQQNLVSASDLPNLRQRHTEDSLQFMALPLMVSPTRWLDMGSGAGFPLVPLAIVLRTTRFVSVEPRGNRARFLTRSTQTLELDVQVVASQVETLHSWPDMLGSMDVVSCRALGSLQDDARRALPLLRPGGFFATLKTEAPPPSIDGYEPLSYVRYRLAGDPVDRHLVFAQKPFHGQ
ncbi:MAG: class I SAM-dependent methyltransferase [Fibrobacteria bacterium]|nr:class I SAM-dependent methyltransferase [Fibrobacteria bacterium]